MAMDTDIPDEPTPPADLSAGTHDAPVEEDKSAPAHEPAKEAEEPQGTDQPWLGVGLGARLA